MAICRERSFTTQAHSQKRHTTRHEINIPVHPKSILKPRNDSRYTKITSHVLQSEHSPKQPILRQRLQPPRTSQSSAVTTTTAVNNLPAACIGEFTLDTVATCLVNSHYTLCFHRSPPSRAALRLIIQVRAGRGGSPWRDCNDRGPARDAVASRRNTCTTVYR